jgi:hypothetical protein
MPTDIQIFAGGSFAGLVTFDAEVFSVISEYRINKKAPAGIFDEFVIKVLPDARQEGYSILDEEPEAQRIFRGEECILGN